jgi:hypothetical protein
MPIRDGVGFVLHLCVVDFPPNGGFVLHVAHHQRIATRCRVTNTERGAVNGPQATGLTGLSAIRSPVWLRFASSDARCKSAHFRPSPTPHAGFGGTPTIRIAALPMSARGRLASFRTRAANRCISPKKRTDRLACQIAHFHFGFVLHFHLQAGGTGHFQTFIKLHSSRERSGSSGVPSDAGV